MVKVYTEAQTTAGKPKRAENREADLRAAKKWKQANPDKAKEESWRGRCGSKYMYLSYCSRSSSVVADVSIAEVGV